MPHGFWGLGWGEVVSLITLVMVVANYFKSSVSKTAHESSRKDLEDLNTKLTDFKINVSELSQLLRQVNKDIEGIDKRVGKLEEEIDKVHVQMAKLKARIGGSKHDEDYH